MDIKKLQNRIFAESNFVLFTTFLSSLYVLIDHIYISRISLDYLASEVLLAYISVLFIIMARVVGQAHIIKVNMQSEKEFCLKSLSAFALFCLPLLILLYVLTNPILSQLKLQYMSGIYPFYWVYAFTGFLIGFNLLVKFIFVSEGRSKHSFYADLAGNLFNVVGNSAALLVFEDKGLQFIGVGIASLVSQICVSIVLLYILLKGRSYSFFVNHFKEAVSFIHSTKSILTGDLLTNFLRAISPFFITLIVRDRFGDIYAVAYNIAVYFYHLFERPFVSVAITSLPLLGRYLSKKDTELFNVVRSYSKRLLFRWSLFVLCIFCILPVLIPYFYGIEAKSVIAIIAIVLSPSLFSALNMLPINFLKLERKQVHLALMELFLGDLLSCLLLVLVSRYLGSVHLIFALSFIVPKLLIIVFLRLRSRSSLNGFLNSAG